MSSPTDRAERSDPRARRAVSRAARVSLAALSMAFEESQRLVGRGARRGACVLPADARGHRLGVVLGAHQPVRLPARRRGRQVRGGARREGGGGHPGAARRRPAGLRSRARLAGALRAAHRSGCRGLRRARDEASRAGRARSATGGATRWNLRGLGHIDHRKVVVVDGRIGWVGGAGIEDHFEDGRFHDLFVRVDGPGRPRSCSSSSSAASAGSAARVQADELDDALPGAGRRGRARFPPSSCTTRPGATGRSPTRSRACSTSARRDARRGQSLRHRPRHDPAHRAGCAPRRPRAAVRPREREQLGVRRRAAVPPRRRCWTRACGSSSTRPCSMPRRSCATARSCSREPATSRPGA